VSDDERQVSVEKHFVEVTDADRAIPGRLEELDALAKASGRMLLHKPTPVHAQSQLAAALARPAGTPGMAGA
jgi:hypothetical protein